MSSVSVWQCFGKDRAQRHKENLVMLWLFEMCLVSEKGPDGAVESWRGCVHCQCEEDLTEACGS